jgi:HK97 family phage major capsid protein
MSAEMIKRLLEERGRVIGEQRSVIDAADQAKRDLTAEEGEKFDRTNTTLIDLDKRLEALHETEARNKRAEEIRAEHDKVIRPDNGGEQRSEAEELEAEFRSFLSGEKRGVDVRRETPMGRNELRTLSKLSAGAGGNTVKTSFYDQLMQNLIEVAGLMQAGPNLLTTSSGETIQVPKTTAHSTASLVAETGVIPTSDPAFGQASLGAYKYGVLVQFSNELINDSSVDLLGYLSMETGRAVGNAVGGHLITGTGSAQPTGVLTGASAGVTGGSGVAGAFTSDNLIDLYYSVISPYRNSPSAAWMMRDASLGAVRKLKDTTGQYLWQPSIQVGVPDTLLGKPIYTDPNIPAVALSGKSVLFGDFSRYLVRQVNTVRFERSDEFAFSSDLVTFRCLYRADGTLVDTTGAIKYFIGNAA